MNYLLGNEHNLFLLNYNIFTTEVVRLTLRRLTLHDGMHYLNFC